MILIEDSIVKSIMTVLFIAAVIRFCHSFLLEAAKNTVS